MSSLVCMHWSAILLSLCSDVTDDILNESWQLMPTRYASCNTRTSVQFLCLSLSRHTDKIFFCGLLFYVWRLRTNYNRVFRLGLFFFSTWWERESDKLWYSFQHFDYQHSIWIGVQKLFNDCFWYQIKCSI